MTAATPYQPLAQSYMKALQNTWILDCARGLGSLGASSDLHSGDAIAVRDQSCGKGGRGYVGLNKEVLLRALSKMHSNI